MMDCRLLLKCLVAMQAKPIPPAHTFNYGGARINIYHADKGTGLPSHTHDYSHATFCTAGSCIVRTPKATATINKDSQPLNLIGTDWHEIEAAEDGTIFVNVFAEGRY